MPSRFPGMDPFLENPAHFHGFHARFINVWSEILDAQLPEGYFADLGESAYEEEEVVPRGTYPLICTGVRPQGHIEILHQPGRELVAVLELLSPTNKENPGRASYLLKREQLLNQRIHLIELDLLRGGRRMPFGRDLPLGDYFAMIARTDQRPNAQVYAWPLAHRLPIIPIPLRSGDADVSVDLQVVFDTAFERGRYDRKVDYSQPPRSSFDDSTRAWIAEQVKLKEA